MSILNRIQRYRLEDALTQLKSIHTGHLVLIVFAIGLDLQDIFSNPHSTICAILAAVFFTLNMVHSWKSRSVNSGILLAYILSVILEFSAVGIPDAILEPANTMSKGSVLDLLAASTPFIYVGIRVLLAAPLIRLIWLQGNIK